MRIAVIGAGPAGLTAALQLTKGGMAVDVYEAGSQVGGLARSFDLWGRRVDLGPHRFFSADSRVNRFWLEIVGTDYVMIDRLTRIHFQGRFFHYPLRPWDVLRNLGPAETSWMLASYARERLSHRPVEDGEESFETWVVRRFGRRLYETFFKTYSEKLWGLPCTQLSADFAAQRIRKLTLSDAVSHAVFRRTSSEHRTLADSFAYPREGTGIVYERIASRIVAGGGTIFLNRPIAGVCLEDGRATGVRQTDGTVAPYDHIISTMPLTGLVNGLNSAPESVRRAASNLGFRNTILVYLEVSGSRHFDDQWLYIHDAGVQIGRITNFNNWGPSAANYSTSILCCELWCNHTERAWTASDEELAQLVITDLRKLKLIEGHAIHNHFIVRIPRCYPVYRIGYRQHVDVISRYLKEVRGISVIGRYGAFKYNNQDHSILMGLLAADNLLYAQRHDLWTLNSDVESYQERALITESGLTFAESSHAEAGCPMSVS